MATPPHPNRTTYISSTGQPLTTPPLTARLNRTLDNAYNFLGLYFVSLFSLDPYTAAQNSRFNTRGGSSVGGAREGGRGPGGNGGSGGGGGGGGGGRRLGTVDDVRGPECGSCG